MKRARVAGLCCLLLACLGCGLRAESVRVATLNVANYLMTDRMVETTYRRDYPKPEVQKAALRALLRAVNADVIALQEIGPEPFLRELQRDLEHEGLAYPHKAWLKGADADRHLAVLSRVPFHEVIEHNEVVFSYFQEPILVKRGLLEIVFQTSAGEWRLFNLHLKSRYTNRADDPQSEERRVGEARALRDLIRERLRADAGARFLVAGDVNDTLGSRALARFLEINDEPFLSLVPCADSRGETWTHYYKREDIYSRVDYFLGSPGILKWVDGGEGSIVDEPSFSAASDHRLLFLDLRVESEE